MTTVTVRWAGASDAVSGTTYAVLTDDVTPGTITTVLAATQAATSPYVSVTTTLANTEPITKSDVSLTFTLATGFTNGTDVRIEEEVILLGGLSGSTFTTCTRGQGGSIPLPHVSLSTITKLHESYAAAVTFGARYMRRFLVKATTSSVTSVAARIIGYNPPTTPDSSRCTVYGFLENGEGLPMNGVEITCKPGDGDNYLRPVGSTIFNTVISRMTDADGFFYFFIPRTTKQNQINGTAADTWTLTISIGDDTSTANATEAEAIVLTFIPDKNSANYLECFV